MQQFLTGKTITQGGGYAETYGFVVYILTYILEALFLIWAFVPKWVYDSLDLKFIGSLFPNQYWVLALGALLVLTAFGILTIYLALIWKNEIPFSSASSYTDSRCCETSGEQHGDIPAVEDYDISEISGLLYEGRSVFEKNRTALKIERHHD